MGTFYISEEKAAERLSRLIERSITVEDMYEYAHLGVVPAYMKFKPEDKKLYPGQAFHLVADAVASKLKQCDLTTFEGHEADWSEVLPFPLSKNGIVNTSIDVAFRVYVARSDARLEAVSEHHYVRVYAPQEVNQAAKNLKLYVSGHGFQPINHSCGETWEIERDHDHDQRTAWITSPFADDANAVNLKKRIRKDNALDSISDEGPPGMKMIIAGMIELIEELSAKQGRKYTRTNIREWIQSRFPELPYRGMGVGEDSIKKSFAAASRERKRNDKIAEQRDIELASEQGERTKSQAQK